VLKGTPENNFDLLTHANNGAPLWLNVTVVSPVGFDEPFVAHIIRDVTREKRTALALEQFLADLRFAGLTPHDISTEKPISLYPIAPIPRLIKLPSHCRKRNRSTNADGGRALDKKPGTKAGYQSFYGSQSYTKYPCETGFTQQGTGGFIRLQKGNFIIPSVSSLMQVSQNPLLELPKKVSWQPDASRTPIEHLVEYLLTGTLASNAPSETGDLAKQVMSSDLQKTRIVVLGGGTGLSTIIGGNSQMPDWPDQPCLGMKQQFPLLNSIVCTTDDGGSTGLLLKSLPMIGIGDLRKY